HRRLVLERLHHGFGHELEDATVRVWGLLQLAVGDLDEHALEIEIDLFEKTRDVLGEIGREHFFHELAILAAHEGVELLRVTAKRLDPLLAHFTTPSFFPTFANASIARSTCFGSCAAESCTRMRASPFGTTG